MQCPVCSHTLDGSTMARCPECGTVLTLVAADGQRLLPGPRTAALLILAVVVLFACVNVVFVAWDAEHLVSSRDESALRNADQQFLEREFKLMVSNRTPAGASSTLRSGPISLPPHEGVTARDWLQAVRDGGPYLAVTVVLCLAMLHGALSIVIRRFMPAATDPRRFSRALALLTLTATLLILASTASFVWTVARR